MKKYRSLRDGAMVDAFTLGWDEQPEWFIEALAAGKVVKHNKTWVFYPKDDLVMTADRFDRVIRNDRGVIYPCPDHCFDDFYEELS